MTVQEFESELAEKAKRKLGENAIITTTIAHAGTNGNKRLYFNEGKLIGLYIEVDGNVEAEIFIK